MKYWIFYVAVMFVTSQNSLKFKNYIINFIKKNSSDANAHMYCIWQTTRFKSKRTKNTQCTGNRDNCFLYNCPIVRHIVLFFLTPCTIIIYYMCVLFQLLFQLCTKISIRYVFDVRFENEYLLFSFFVYVSSKNSSRMVQKIVLFLYFITITIIIIII